MVFKLFSSEVDALVVCAVVLLINLSVCSVLLTKLVVVSSTPFEGVLVIILEPTVLVPVDIGVVDVSLSIVLPATVLAVVVSVCPVVLVELVTVLS